MENTNLRVLTVNTNKTLLDQTAINNGAIYFVEDTKELFYDFNGSRLAIQDIVTLDKEEDRTSILFAPLNKFYFVLETSTLWYYKSQWYKISSDPELATTVKAGIVQLATDDEVEEGTSETKVVTVKQLATYSNNLSVSYETESKTLIFNGPEYLNDISKQLDTLNGEVV